MSYLVSDIGKRGVPRLSVRERAMIERIRDYVHSKSLRFAWVGYHKPIGEPIVFDAYDGPCEVGSLGYPVLNGPCGVYYKPGENPYDILPTPGEDCYRASPRPWMH